MIRDRPGLALGALSHLIGTNVFLRLSDVASDLPPYEEHVLFSNMTRKADDTGFFQRKAYDHISGVLRQSLAAALARGSKRLLGAYLQTLLAFPDGRTRGDTVFDPGSGMPFVRVQPLSEENVYPKEQALLDLVAAERHQGRSVLIYATHTGTRDLTVRWRDILTRHDLRVAVLKADTVVPDRRKTWVAQKVHEGIGVLLWHPRLVQTGLNLTEFPTIVWGVKGGEKMYHGGGEKVSHRGDEKEPKRGVGGDKSG